MNCTEATERAAWLLNGTLPEAERSEVMRHLRECGMCRKELDETAAVMEGLASHPDAERIVEFVFGTGMEADERRSIQAHLELCGECREQVQLARASRQAMPGRAPVRYRVLAIAAMVLVAISVGSLLNVWQRTRQREAMLESKVKDLEARIGRMQQPGAAGRVVDLLPRQSRERLGPDAERQRTTIGSGVETILLLNSTIAASAPGCAIRLLRGDSVSWEAAEVRRGSGGEFVVRVPGGYLEKGLYRVVASCQGQEESFEFAVE